MNQKEINRLQSLERGLLSINERFTKLLVKLPYDIQDLLFDLKSDLVEIAFSLGELLEEWATEQPKKKGKKK